MSTVWSKEKAWAWYQARTWMRGCNFMGSDCANRIDQWQALGFEERLATADRELRALVEAGEVHPRARKRLLTLTRDGAPAEPPLGVIVQPAYEWMLATAGDGGPEGGD